jgi:hypothetical protein
MNQNQKYLKHVEQRIRSVNINKPEGWQPTLEYLQLAKDAITEGMSQEEITEVYDILDNKKTAKELEAEMAQQMKDMEFNRDKPAI